MQNISYKTVKATLLKQWLHDGGELALLDVREAGQFGEGHLLLANPLPYSRLEIDVRRLVPRLTTRIVLVDETGTDVSPRAAQRLQGLGYGDVTVLSGGMLGWAKAGFEVFAGVNVPSKAFGELAELHFETPHISAVELASKLANNRDVVVLDGRPIPEYQKMSIPSATCCPNGELSLRIDDLVPNKETQIVINCAGRTRSIIGAQTLINLGIVNPVYALENGTQGWYLNDLKLDHGADRVFGPVPAGGNVAERVQRAQALADRYGIARVDARTLQAWWADASRTTYLCDVRTPAESQQKPIPHAVSTPGGQLIQATDQYIATRGARVVLVDDDDVRAPVVSTWLYMLGWDVSVLPASEVAALAEIATTSVTPRATVCEPITAAELARLQADQVPVLDIRAGMQYRQSHVAGAVWSIRPVIAETLAQFVPTPSAVVLISAEREVAELVAVDLREQGVQKVYCCTDDAKAWQAAGLALESTPDQPSNEQCIDYLFFVHDRHDGNKEAARQYLAWEVNLLAQLDEQEKAIYRFLPQSSS